MALILFGRPLAASQRQHNLRLSFDCSTFKYDSAKTYVEFHYSFNKNSIDYAAADSSFSGAVIFHLFVKSISTDAVVYSPQWKVPVTVADTSSGSLDRSAVGQVAAALAPGDYELHISAVDGLDTANVDTFSERLSVPRYGNSKLELSDVELCSTISSSGSDQQGVFYKNTYEVVPNPSDVFGVGLPIVFYYTEVYNIPMASGSDSTFTAGYKVMDSYGQVLKSHNINRVKFGSSSVEVGTINASNLKTGVYELDFTVSDSGARVSAVSSHRFFVYNPHLGAPVQPPSSLAGSSVLSSVYASMGQAQLDQEFDEARYVSTSAEREQYKKLDGVDAKRRFLYGFWKRLNENPVAAGNDFRTQYLEKVAYANQHFSVGNIKGWKTDRGRVYIVYGKPDEIDRHPNESDSKPYEVWYYNSIEGGVSFDFVDRTGFGDYMLVNSTARTEIHNDNWQQYLGTGGGY